MSLDAAALEILVLPHVSIPGAIAPVYRHNYPQNSLRVRVNIGDCKLPLLTGARAKVHLWPDSWPDRILSMPVPQQVSSEANERRDAARREVRMAAKAGIRFDAPVAVHRAQYFADGRFDRISAIDGTAEDDFESAIDSAMFSAECELRHQNGCMAGVRFTSNRMEARGVWMNIHGRRRRSFDTLATYRKLYGSMSSGNPNVAFEFRASADPRRGDNPANRFRAAP